MRLLHLGKNQTELRIGTKAILFSYETPVAYYDVTDCRLYVTSKKWSSTTIKHIKKWDWCVAILPIEVNQRVLDTLFDKGE